MATTSSGSGTVPTVVIVGAGAAGIFTAYQLNQQFPGKYDIRLFEAAPQVGGNVSSVDTPYGGQTYVIDAGAQFFYPKAQPNYVNLIQALGLSGVTPNYSAGITIWESATDRRLLWVPATIGGFSSYTLEDWARLVEFGAFFVASALLNAQNSADWSLTVDEWLNGLGLMTEDFKQNVVKNFLYQFVSLPYASIGQASALYAITYFVRNVIGGLPPAAGAAQSIGDYPTFQTSQSLIGLLGILEATLTASGVTAQTSSPVTSVAAGPSGVTVTVNGSAEPGPGELLLPVLLAHPRRAAALRLVRAESRLPGVVPGAERALLRGGLDELVRQSGSGADVGDEHRAVAEGRAGAVGEPGEPGARRQRNLG